VGVPEGSQLAAGLDTPPPRGSIFEKALALSFSRDGGVGGSGGLGKGCWARHPSHLRKAPVLGEADQHQHEEGPSDRDGPAG